MHLNKILWRNSLLALFVSVFSLGLFSSKDWYLERPILICQALSQGLIIGQFYYWLHERSLKNLQIFLLCLSAIFYLWTYEALWGHLFFWLFLLLLFFAALTYEQFLNWRRIPYLKNLIIPILWFIFLNIIPGMSGVWANSSVIWLLFYFALSLQADREDLDQDNGQIKTIAGLLGGQTSGYLVIFLLALCAYLLLLPLAETIILLIIMNREQFFPKRSFDSLLFLLGLYFLFH